jgi:hypothetical protein
MYKKKKKEILVHCVKREALNLSILQGVRREIKKTCQKPQPNILRVICKTEAK